MLHPVNVSFYCLLYLCICHLTTQELNMSFVCVYFSACHLCFKLGMSFMSLCALITKYFEHVVLSKQLIDRCNYGSSPPRDQALLAYLGILTKPKNLEKISRSGASLEYL